jgi:hypothetical protein
VCECMCVSLCECMNERVFVCVLCVVCVVCVCE